MMPVTSHHAVAFSVHMLTDLAQSADLGSRKRTGGEKETLKHLTYCRECIAFST